MERYPLLNVVLTVSFQLSYIYIYSSHFSVFDDIASIKCTVDRLNAYNPPGSTPQEAYAVTGSKYTPKSKLFLIYYCHLHSFLLATFPPPEPVVRKPIVLESRVIDANEPFLDQSAPQDTYARTGSKYTPKSKPLPI